MLQEKLSTQAQLIVNFENTIEQYKTKERELKATIEDTNSKYDVILEKFGIIKSSNEQLEQTTSEEIQRLKDQIKDMKDDQRIKDYNASDSKMEKRDNLKLRSPTVVSLTSDENKVNIESNIKENTTTEECIQCDYYAVESFYLSQADKIIKMIDSFSIENHIKLHK